MVSNNRQEGFRGVLQLLALSASVFRFMLRWQMGFICPNDLDCNTTSLETVFVIFARLSQCSTVAAVEAGHLCACWSPGDGRARIQGLSSPEWAVCCVSSRAVLFQGLEIHPHWRCPTLCTCRVALGKAGGRAQAVAAAEHLQAATPLFLCPEMLLSLAWIQKLSLWTFLPQMLLHVSPAFVFRAGCTLLGATFDLDRVLEIINFGDSLSPWAGGRDHQQFLISFESGCSWSKKKKAFTKY